MTDNETLQFKLLKELGYDKDIKELFMELYVEYNKNTTDLIKYLSDLDLDEYVNLNRTSAVYKFDSFIMFVSKESGLLFKSYIN